MLEHVACPQCHAQNLRTEVICFACGAPLGKRPKVREAPPSLPWVLWVGMAFALAALGCVAAGASQLLAAYRLGAGIPSARMLAVVGVLFAVGQVALYRSRREDRWWWELKRVPDLPLTQIHAEDATWVRGTVQCDTPLDLPYTADEKCVYYHVVVKERDDDGRGGWHTTQNETNAVDFTVAAESGEAYVPSGGVRYEAPLFVDTFLADGVKAQVWAIALQTPISVCGRVEAQGEPRLLRRLSEAVPVVATWRFPSDYLAELAKRGRRAQWFGWAVSLVAAVVLIATVARG
jgi:hypothetical protein